MQQSLIQVFSKWGLPAYIKVDNGRPFGDPQQFRIPALALWLIGLGIKVIWNRLRIPQDNAKVERVQGVLSNWIEAHKCVDQQQLQAQLLQEAHFQRSIFPVRRLGGKTRTQAFPALEQKLSTFNPDKFDLQRVLDFLAKGHWQRTVNTVGQASLFGRIFQVESKYKNQQVSVKLNPQANTWIFFDPNGRLIKELNTQFTAISICNLD